MNRLTRILPITAVLMSVTLVLGCANDVAGPSEPSMIEVRGEPFAVSALCEPQPSAMASGWIGPKGGSLTVGNHVLKVPPKALATTEWITLEAPSSSINHVILGSAGLTFNSRYPAQLVLSYANCSAPGQAIARIDGGMRILEVRPSLSDPATLTVTGALPRIPDLSTYAVVY